MYSEYPVYIMKGFYAMHPYICLYTSAANISNSFFSVRIIYHFLDLCQILVIWYMMVLIFWRDVFPFFSFKLWNGYTCVPTIVSFTDPQHNWGVNAYLCYFPLSRFLTYNFYLVYVGFFFKFIFNVPSFFSWIPYRWKCRICNWFAAKRTASRECIYGAVTSFSCELWLTFRIVNVLIIYHIKIRFRYLCRKLWFACYHIDGKICWIQLGRILFVQSSAATASLCFS